MVYNVRLTQVLRTLHFVLSYFSYNFEKNIGNDQTQPYDIKTLFQQSISNSTKQHKDSKTGNTFRDWNCTILLDSSFFGTFSEAFFSNF